MKIIITNSSPIWGGNENWAVTAARLLRERSHRVTMILKRGSEVVERAQQLGIPVITVPRFGGDLELPTLFRLYRILSAERPNAVILTKTKDYWVCGLTSWLANIPIRILRLSIVRAVKDDPKYKLIYRRFVNKVLVNSKEVEEGIRQSAQWLKAIQIHVLYNGIAVPNGDIMWVNRQREKARTLRRKWGIPDDAFVFGACVNITYRKRLDLIVSALANLHDELPAAHAVLAGEGNARTALEAQAQRLGIRDRVHFPGYFQDVTPLYYLFDVYVIASQQESMTYVGMEAMAHGCPVLATDCGGIKELLDSGKSGMIVPVNELSALQDGMLKLATDPERRSRFAKSGRERFEKHFTEDKMAINLEAILKGLPQPCVLDLEA